MKRLIVVVLMMLVCGTALADKVSVPFECWPQDLKERFEARGYELSLDANDKTRSTWAFLLNEGSKYHIMTYRPVKVEELNMIREVSTESYFHNTADYSTTATEVSHR